VSCQAADGTQICNGDADWSIAMDEVGTVTKNSPGCLTVASPDLSASTKEIDPASLPAQAGSTIHYFVHVCNQGSGTATNVTVADTLDPSLDETTINAPGATVVGNTITWTIPTLGPGSVATPTCQDLEFWADVRSGIAGGVQICNKATATSDEWISCARVFPTNPACFTTQGTAANSLLREWCGAPPPPCDLTALWNPDLDVYLPSIPAAPASIDDPETGILTDSSKPLAFYQVTSPADPKSVRCLKNTAGQTVTVYY
jgi:uncharacterized repeat protein (TIGR01451 family)